MLAASPDCVIKPARGSSGRGVVLLTGAVAGGYRRHNGSTRHLDELRRHMSDILSGLYSLGGRPDRAIVQQRLRTHPAFERISYRGTPDVRVLVYRGEPAMAMLRLPTLESGGRANLHQGGVGVGVDLEAGRTTRAVWRGRVVTRHPDTGEPLADRSSPDWPAVLAMARTVARATGLGFVGVDVVPDAGRAGGAGGERPPGPGDPVGERASGLQAVLDEIDQRMTECPECRMQTLIRHSGLRIALGVSPP